MFNASSFKRAWLTRALMCILAGSALCCCVGRLRAEGHDASLVGVSLTGVHHMGDKFNVPEFYVNGYDGSNVGREGGGGSQVCCVMLPKKWRPGLSVEVRWAVDDFSHENSEESAAGNYRSIISAGTFVAQVPVERYELAAQLWVHFFTGGKVRVVSSSIASFGTAHPIQGSDSHAIDSATPGKRVAAMFTKKELNEMDRKASERRTTSGDWR